MSDNVRASCTWGDGPDVLLVVESNGKTSYADLDVKAAKELYISLGKAIEQCNELDRISSQ